MNVDTTVTGIPEALRELKRLDPELRKEIPNRFKSAAAPVLDEARRLIPERPASGWSPGGRLGYSAPKVRRSIALRFRANRGRRRTVGEFTVLSLVSGRSPAAAIYDMAGRRSSGRTKQGRALIRKLNEQGRPSRALWEAAERKEPYIRDQIAAVVADVSRRTSRRIERAS